MVVERWSNRHAAQQAPPSADSGYVSADRDVSTSSSPQQSQTSRQTPVICSEDDSDPAALPSAELGTDLPTNFTFEEDFSIGSVISNLFDRPPDNDSVFNFINELDTSSFEG